MANDVFDGGLNGSQGGSTRRALRDGVIGGGDSLKMGAGSGWLLALIMVSLVFGVHCTQAPQL